MFEGGLVKFMAKTLDVTWNIRGISFYLVSFLCALPSALPRAKCVACIQTYYIFPLSTRMTSLRMGGVREARGEKSKQTQSSVTAGKKTLCVGRFRPRFISSAEKKPTVYLNMKYFFPLLPRQSHWIYIFILTGGEDRVMERASERDWSLFGRVSASRENKKVKLQSAKVLQLVTFCFIFANIVWLFLTASVPAMNE